MGEPVSSSSQGLREGKEEKEQSGQKSAVGVLCRYGGAQGMMDSDPDPI